MWELVLCTRYSTHVQDNRIVDRASQRQPEVSILLLLLGLPPVKCLGNKKVPFYLCEFTRVEKNCGLNFCFLTQKWLGFELACFVWLLPQAQRQLWQGRGCSSSKCEPSFYDLLQLLPSFAIPKRVWSTDPPGWHTGAQGTQGGSDFYLLSVTQQSAAGDTLLLLEIFSTSPTDIN